MYAYTSLLSSVSPYARAHFTVSRDHTRAISARFRDTFSPGIAVHRSTMSLSPAAYFQLRTFSSVFVTNTGEHKNTYVRAERGKESLRYNRQGMTRMSVVTARTIVTIRESQTPTLGCYLPRKEKKFTPPLRKN